MLLKSKKFLSSLFGLIIGFVNGTLGAGGGMLAVPLLKKCGFEQRDAHTNAVAVILPICIISASLYLYKGHINLSDAFPFIPSGIVGSIIGTLLIKRISPNLLKKAFGVLMIYAGIRLLVK